MKRIYLILVVTLFVMQLKAQFIYDEWGEIIPFSLTEQYKDVVKTDEIHSLVLPSYDNDSLCRVYNNGKELYELGSVSCGGFPIDTTFNFKENAVSFKIKEGTLWIYTVESPTAGAISVYIKDFDVPEGAYFSIFPGNIPYEIQEPETYIKGEIPSMAKERGIRPMVYDKKMVIEYFEPFNISQKGNFSISQIGYLFIGPGKKKALNSNDHGAGNNLKSGGWTNSPALSCQKDVVCPEGSAWANEARSVIFIRIPFTYNGNPYTYSDGTGFFPNKSGGYSGTDNPILVTCGHLYAPKPDGVNVFDISNNHDAIQIRVDYENENCNET